LDFGVLSPTLVYNCYFVPALCKNVAQYLQGGTTGTFHYDRDKARKTCRRGQSCPDRTWILTPRIDAPGPEALYGHRCPEADQPGTFWYSIYKKDGPLELTSQADVTIFRKDDIPDKNRIGTKGPAKRPADADDVVTYTYTKTGAILSCDEFPAARLVQILSWKFLR